MIIIRRPCSRFPTFWIANKADVIRAVWLRKGCYVWLSISPAILLTYFEVIEFFCALKFCAFCHWIVGVKSLIGSMVGGADGGVSSDICGMVMEPVVQTLADRRTRKSHCHWWSKMPLCWWRDSQLVHPCKCTRKNGRQSAMSRCCAFSGVRHNIIIIRMNVRPASPVKAN